MTWRHHCRSCGWLICDSCSQYRALKQAVTAEGVGPAPDGDLRVCKDCYAHDPDKFKELAIDLAGPWLKDGIGNSVFTTNDDGCMIRLEKIGADGLGDEGLAKLAAGLAYVKRDLVKMFLDSNGITDTGVQALCGPLAECTMLSKLHIRRNQITAVGEAALLRAVPDGAEVKFK